MIAPSESIARLIRRRGVVVPVAVIPTGIDVAAFARGDGAAFRRQAGIPAQAFVAGHVGRLAPEKNLPYLARAVGRFLSRRTSAWFLVVGEGPSQQEVLAECTRLGVAGRLVLAGSRTGRGLRNAYRAMDVFAFSSHTETQGLVVTEAMAAGCPVVALRAPGVSDVLRDGENGFLLEADAPPAEFARQLGRLRTDRALRRRLGRAALDTAAGFSREHCARRALEFYEQVRTATRRRRQLVRQHPWLVLQDRLGVEWDLLTRNVRALSTALAS